MRFQGTDTAAQRRWGRVLVLFAGFILLAGAARVVILIDRRIPEPGPLLLGVLMAFLALGFGGWGIQMIREAGCLEIESEFRKGPPRPLRPAPGLKRRPK